MADVVQVVSFNPSLCSSSGCYRLIMFPATAAVPSSLQFSCRIVSFPPPLAIVGSPLSPRIFPVTFESSLNRGGRARSPPKASPFSSPSKSQEQKWVHEGLITESLPNGMFRVLLDNEHDLILGYISGKIRKSFIRILPGDRVRVEMSRYDSTKGRIVYRLRSKGSKD